MSEKFESPTGEHKYRSRLLPTIDVVKIGEVMDVLHKYLPELVALLTNGRETLTKKTD